MHTRFNSITNELYCLRKVIPHRKHTRKILGVFPNLWKIKFDAISKSKDLKTFTMDELIGNLKTCKLNK